MLPLLMFLTFLLMPVLEIYVIIQVGALIGGWQTAALLLAESLLGAWIVRREGRRAWRTLRETFGRGGMPDRELADAALVLAGGVLLLTPGFVTDVVGFAFVLPFTRPLVRRALTRYAARRVRVAEHRLAEQGLSGMFPPGMDFGAASAFGAGTAPTGGPPKAGAANGSVIRGEVVREDRPET
ncbi:FxsA family protein [Thermomonospora umbrina]|uniref:UPF0716 protein FxsA n=1 Tax=Thermomonospora umbrina TaxID=111806 RepID=A0A3D9T6P2_9ACTN|nr:FxsA family protein [Thermomonospora umbrina]REF00916.1 UPF0716 protein FxsA [Thermomonospora umbrina]